MKMKIKRNLFLATLLLSLLFGWIVIALVIPWLDNTFSAPSLESAMLVGMLAQSSVSRRTSRNALEEDGRHHFTDQLGVRHRQCAASSRLGNAVGWGKRPSGLTQWGFDTGAKEAATC